MGGNFAQGLEAGMLLDLIFGVACRKADSLFKLPPIITNMLRMKYAAKGISGTTFTH